MTDILNRAIPVLVFAALIAAWEAIVRLAAIPPFVLPAPPAGHVWELLFDTADDATPPSAHAGGSKYELKDHALAVLRTRPEPAPPEETAALHRAARGAV